MKPHPPLRPRVSSPASAWTWRGLASAGAAAVLLVGVSSFVRSKTTTSHTPPTGEAKAITPAFLSSATEPNHRFPDEWLATWMSEVRQPDSALRDIALAASIEELAAVDADGALRLVNANSNPDTRAMWLSAALRGWAKVAPRQAVAWFSRLEEAVRAQSAAGLIAGLAASDEPPRELVRSLYDQFPWVASTYGSAYFAELARRGRFTDAVDALPAAAPGEVPELLASTFKPWAGQQPDPALSAAASLSNPEQRAVALQDVASGWAETAPAAAAAYGEQLMPGEWRQTVLLAAAQSWTKTAPQPAVEWLARLAPEPAFDQGAVQIATMPALLDARPDVALRWALSTENPTLRENTVGEVMRYWMTQDPASAQRALAGLTGLDAATRQRVLDSLPGDTTKDPAR